MSRKTPVCDQGGKTMITGIRVPEMGDTLFLTAHALTYTLSGPEHI